MAYPSHFPPAVETMAVTAARTQNPIQRPGLWVPIAAASVTMAASTSASITTGASDSSLNLSSFLAGAGAVPACLPAGADPRCRLQKKINGGRTMTSPVITYRHGIISMNPETDPMMWPLALAHKLSIIFLAPLLGQRPAGKSPAQ